MSRSSDATVLVTGSSGFIGSHLSSKLAGRGYSVVGLDVVPPRVSLPPGVEAIRGDIRDESELRRILFDKRPNVIYHLAAQTSVAVSMRDPVIDVEVNVLATVQLAHLAAEAGVRRLVFFSTGGSLYGQPEQLPVDENTAAVPVSIYGSSKLAAESQLQVLAQQGVFELSVLRPANVYGPHQDSEGEAGVIAIFIARMLSDEPVTIFGDGTQSRDYIYVDDVVDAAMMAASGPFATCLIGTGIGTTTQGVFDKLAELCQYQRAPMFASERPGDITGIELDSSRALSVWGWKPRVNLDHGMATTVEWFRSEASTGSSGRT